MVRHPRCLSLLPAGVDSENAEKVVDIEIPFEDAYREPAQDRQFTRSSFSSQVYLKNVFHSWPKAWQLESIQFLRDTNDIHQDSSEQISNILKKHGGPILISVKR